MSRRLEDHELVYWTYCSGTIYPRLRSVLVERDGDACGNCCEPFGDATPDIDHIVPRFYPGWSGQQWNLRLLCRQCNGGKPDKAELAERYAVARKARHAIGDFRSDDQVETDEHAVFLDIARRKRQRLGRLMDVAVSR